MKSVVVEINDNFVVALSDDGVFTKVKNQNYSIGEVLVMKKNSIKKFSKKSIISLASAAAVVAFGTLSAFAYYTPVSYVSLDLNPSIEYDLNMFDVVIGVTGVNDDGTQLLGDVDLTGQSIDDAISDTVDLLIEDGYITSEEANDIVIATNNSDEDKSDELAVELQEVAENRIVENDVVANVEATSVAKERVAEAKAMGVTPGKLNLVEKLKASSEAPEDVDVSEWLDKPVKEIQSVIKENNAKNQTGIDNSNKNNANKAENQIKTQETEQVKTQEQNTVQNKTENQIQQETPSQNDMQSQNGVENSNNSKIEEKKTNDESTNSNANNSSTKSVQPETPSKGNSSVEDNSVSQSQAVGQGSSENGNGSSTSNGNGTSSTGSKKK